MDAIVRGSSNCNVGGVSRFEGAKPDSPTLINNVMSF